MFHNLDKMQMVGLKQLVLLPLIGMGILSGSPQFSAFSQESRPSQLGKQLQQQVQDCVGRSSSATQSTQRYQTCITQLILLDDNGNRRSDASQRLLAFFEAMGIAIPKRQRQGQTVVNLQAIPRSNCFSLPVKIKGYTGQFLLDTGATHTVINTRLGKQLDLPLQDYPPNLTQGLAFGSGNKTQIGIYPAQILSIEEASVQQIHPLGMSQQAILYDLSGILGLDFLSQFDMVIDPSQPQIQLLPPTPQKGGISLTGKGGWLTVQVMINGQGPFTFALDTGATQTIVSPKLADQLALSRSAKPVQLQGLLGMEAAQPTQLNSIQIGQHQTTELNALILASPLIERMQVDGLIGQNFLNQYRQHWWFGAQNALGMVEQGTLHLSPLQP
ncbi:retropepsin-like aspartic protease [Acaryochloris sp. IP29b_bin.137]|uniref:retropepsin-like aspartic protease n=1 Tax=Acaryochloris sp. IP29b_bin.137 TaxID=2969217 RepID=UPI00263A3438|nr:retropepsin-like aspartic protease [Acaryochloris sp. IP29b_bin.137]